MGYCGSPYQVGSFSAGKDNTYGKTICTIVYGPYCESPWNFKDNHFGPGYSIHSPVLGTFSCRSWYTTDPQFSLSSSDRWPDRENQSDSGGYAQGVCTHLQSKMR